MKDRLIATQLTSRLENVPAVVLLGSRQVGKTTLARAIAEERGGMYLDLESPIDRAKLSDPEAYLSDCIGSLLVLDEIHRVPDLFPILRGRIDEGRRRGIRGGMYLLLGSASIELLDRSAESLAGRVSYLELHPLCLLEMGEITPEVTTTLWLRGGYPDSVLATTTESSHAWRMDFIRTYLEREVPQFAPRRSTEQMRQLWTMLAHLQGQVLNASMLARSIGVDFKTIQAYVNLLEQLLLIRVVQPWHVNIGKRLTKRPKVYIRDSGLLHALLGIRTYDELTGHPSIGSSWEGFVVQQLSAVGRGNVEISFYRTSAGAEVDVLLRFSDGEQWAIEVKRNSVPTPRRGFHEAIKDLTPQRSMVVYPGTQRYRIRENIEAIPLHDLLLEVAARF
ncbi:MAG: ATP-binding protein [Candidatus Kapabacteria bacterium]|nr:ATP-binding protein [Candidatus Kapabacteria bacterium]